MQDTIEQIENLSEKTGVDMTDVTRPGYDLNIISRKLRAASKGSIGDARARAAEAARGTPANFDTKWNEALQQGIAAYIGKELYEAAADTLFARESSTEKTMAWAAIDKLSDHIDKLGQALHQLDISNIQTAEQAIAAGSATDYTKANEIIDELQEIADLPSLDRSHRALWVVIEPPLLPTIRATVHGDMLTEEHTPAELRLIKEASDIEKAPNFRAQILTAARHGWKINAATSESEFITRSRAWYSASHISHGAITRPV